MIIPFFGLSVLLHIGVIVWHKIVTSLFPYRTRRRKKTSPAVSLIFGVISIFSILLFVFFCGITIMYASLHEAHSSIYAAESALPYITHFNYVGAFTEMLSVLLPYSLIAIHRVVSSNPYQMLFLVSCVSLLCIFLWSHGMIQAVTFIGRRVPMYKFFIGVGAVVLLVGAASFMYYLMPVDSVAAYLRS